MSTSAILLIGVGLTCLGLFAFVMWLDRRSTHHPHRK